MPEAHYTRESVGDCIKRLRESKGYTQAELGRRCGYTGSDPQSRISHYERGNRQPNLQELQKIAAALSVSVDEILNASSDKASVLDPEITALLKLSTDEERAVILAALRLFTAGRANAQDL